MITENLSALKIHKLTQAQYDRELAAGNIDETALYLTPDEESKNTWYGTCPTAYATTDKVVTTSTGDFSLEVGNIVYVLFTYTAYASSTLNVDDTGTITIKAFDATDVSTYQWAPNEVVGFVYDGEYFRMIDGRIASTKYYGMTKLSSSTSSTSTTLAATPSAVKEAYDLATTANTNATAAKAAAEDANTTANSAYSLAEDKADADHTHTITANASDDDVVVLAGTSGSNQVTYAASHANSGVAAGTYKSVTVNAKGHVTAGTNPTTLSGYGITDAAPAYSYGTTDLTAGSSSLATGKLYFVYE